VQATALVLCFITAATFLPLRLPARAGVFGLMALGQLALDLGWPSATPLSLRLTVFAAILVAAAVVLFVMENHAASQRRGLALRHHLEETVAALEASRARAAASARAVSELAARVAHEVNNPLSAVKVNVRWLAEAAPGQAQDAAEHAAQHAAERAEVVADTVGAVERIARIVTDLKQQAVAHAPEGTWPPGRAPIPSRGRGEPV